MELSMTDPVAIAGRYIALWNETDAGRRRGLVEAGWTADASYVDPLMQGAGYEAIDGLIAAVQTRFPGHRFALAGTPDGHGGNVRFTWKLAAEDGEAIAQGTDFALVAQDGRLKSVTGFLDFVRT
jgi:hypothetical protein